MGMVPVLWSSTADGGKFDSNGPFSTSVEIPSSLTNLNIGIDWKVASGEITGSQSFTIFEDIMRNGTASNTGCDISKARNDFRSFFP